MWESNCTEGKGRELGLEETRGGWWCKREVVEVVVV
jgi:hypothetical protein